MLLWKVLDSHTFFPHKGCPWITQSKFKKHVIWIFIHLNPIFLSFDYINQLGASCMIYSFCYKCIRRFLNRSVNPSFAYSPCISTIQGGWIWVTKKIRISLGFEEREEAYISGFMWLSYLDHSKKKIKALYLAELFLLCWRQTSLIRKCQTVIRLSLVSIFSMFTGHG